MPKIGHYRRAAELLGVFSDRDFLELGRLLATDAIPGLEGFNVADFAEITHPVEPSVRDGVEALDLECSIGFHRPLEPHFAVRQALVLQSMVDVSGVAGEGLVLAVISQHGTFRRGGQQHSLQDCQVRGRGLGGGQRRDCQNHAHEQPRRNRFQ